MVTLFDGELRFEVLLLNLVPNQNTGNGTNCELVWINYLDAVDFKSAMLKKLWCNN